MTITEALRTASKRVQVDHYSTNQWRVRHWSPEHNAWWEGNITDRISAFQAAHERKVQITLELLGIEDSNALANSCTYNAYPKDWRQCVRDELKADKLREETCVS